MQTASPLFDIISSVGRSDKNDNMAMLSYAAGDKISMFFLFQRVFDQRPVKSRPVTEGLNYVATHGEWVVHSCVLRFLMNINCEWNKKKKIVIVMHI